MAEESFVAMWTTITSWFTPTTLFLILNLMIGTIVLSSKLSKRNPTQNPTRNFNPAQNFFRASTILERVKSVNFSQYVSELSTAVKLEPSQTGSILERVKSFNFSFNTYNSEPERENHDQHANNSDSEREFQLRNANNSETDRDSGMDSTATRDELNAHRGAPVKKKSVGKPPVTKEISGEVPAKKKISGEAPVKKMMRSASEKMRFWRSYPEEEEKVDDVELRRPATVRGGEGSEAVSARDGQCVDSQADDFINKFRQQLKLQRLDSMLRYSDMITRGSSR